VILTRTLPALHPDWLSLPKGRTAARGAACFKASVPAAPRARTAPRGRSAAVERHRRVRAEPRRTNSRLQGGARRREDEATSREPPPFLDPALQRPKLPGGELARLLGLQALQ